MTEMILKCEECGKERHFKDNEIPTDFGWELCGYTEWHTGFGAYWVCPSCLQGGLRKPLKTIMEKIGKRIWHVKNILINSEKRNIGMRRKRKKEAQDKCEEKNNKDLKKYVFRIVVTDEMIKDGDIYENCDFDDWIHKGKK